MRGRVDGEKVSSAIDGIYEAAIDSARWHDAVRSMCTLFNASRTCFAKFDPGTGSFEHVSTETDPESVRQLKQFKHNVMLDTACNAPVGEIYNDQAKIGARRLQRTAFWNDWARPRDMFGSLTCKIHVDKSTFWFLDLQRGRNSETFDTAEVQMLKRLLPHVLRAGRLSRTFQAKQTLGSVFQSLPFGLVIVDRDRTILASNAVADELLAGRESGLAVRANRLVAIDPADAKRIDELVARTSSISPDGSQHPGGDMLLRSKSGGENARSFALSVGPLNSTTLFGTSLQSCSAIFIKEVQTKLPHRFEAYLQSSFDLSPSEAKLARDLADGKSLKDISADSGLRLKTARTYLDRIFRKTDTHQQSQLVALLRSTAPFGPVS